MTLSIKQINFLKLTKNIVFIAHPFIRYQFLNLGFSSNSMFNRSFVKPYFILSSLCYCLLFYKFPYISII